MLKHELHPRFVHKRKKHKKGRSNRDFEYFDDPFKLAWFGLEVAYDTFGDYAQRHEKEIPLRDDYYVIASDAVTTSGSWSNMSDGNEQG
ncbi:hypothetical protein AX16_003558 [Volvariella volvacea WC 439]|nr:hypothetical protein AX16_003558 [Volvariella volvacea WC 439]